MSSGHRVAETREVHDFDRVILRDYGALAITQGDEESLTIEAEPDILAQIETEVVDGGLDIRIGGSWFDKLRHAVATSLVRQRIKYSLCVKTLTGLEVLGAARVRAPNLKIDHLALSLTGAGDIKVASLAADDLEVDLRGGGRIVMSGQVGAQRVVVGGAGIYDASGLETRSTAVDITGAGSATVWTIEDLSVAIRGMGSLEYYGPATVKKTISGAGSVTHLGSGP
jgi:hypothetical protein